MSYRNGVDPSRPLRPALLPSSYAPHIGGVERVTQRLAEGLLSSDDRPIVVTNRWPKSLPSTECVGGVRVNRLVFRVPEPNVRQMGGWVLTAACTGTRLTRLLRQAHVDFINVHCLSSNGRYALNAARHLRLPLILSVHGELSGDATSVFTRSAMLRSVLRRTVAAADAITAPSRFSLDELCRWIDEDLADRARVIPNGVDLVTEVKKQADRPPLVVAAGRLVRIKGFDLLIQAFAKIGKTTNYRLVIVGDGHERESLARMVGELGIENSVSITGFLPEDEVRKLMTNAQIVVVPSRAEAQGLTLLEGMAAGAAIVAADVGGIPEVVRDSVEAYLVPPEDIASLVNRIGDLIMDPVKRQSLADGAQKRVVNYSWETTLAKYRSCYRAVLA